MSNQSLREAALECKRLADNYAGACAGCDPGEFATKERDALHVAIDKLTALAQPDDQAQPVATQRDRLLAALERSAKAESMLRSLVDECDNDSVEGWEDRMRAIIECANRLLSSTSQPPAEQGAELSDIAILAITTAYEQGVGKGHQAYKSGNEIANPYESGKWKCDRAWQLGYEEGKEQADRAARGGAA